MMSPFYDDAFPEISGVWPDSDEPKPPTPKVSGSNIAKPKTLSQLARKVQEFQNQQKNLQNENEETLHE